MRSTHGGGDNVLTWSLLTRLLETEFSLQTRFAGRAASSADKEDDICRHARIGGLVVVRVWPPAGKGRSN